MLYQQTFQVGDLLFLVILSLLEIFLSLDNGVVISSILLKVKEEERKQLLILGAISAFIFRLVALFLLFHMLYFRWIRIIGGIYLIYLGVSFFTKKKSRKTSQTPLPMIKAFFLIEFVDIIFALDSMIAAIGLASFYLSPTEIEHKVWIIYLGGIIGMLFIRYLTLPLSSYIEEKGWIQKGAHAFIFLIGLKLIVDGLL